MHRAQHIGCTSVNNYRTYCVMKPTGVRNSSVGVDLTQINSSILIINTLFSMSFQARKTAKHGFSF